MNEWEAVILIHSSIYSTIIFLNKYVVLCRVTATARLRLRLTVQYWYAYLPFNCCISRFDKSCICNGRNNATSPNNSYTKFKFLQYRIHAFVISKNSQRKNFNLNSFEVI